MVVWVAAQICEPSNVYQKEHAVTKAVRITDMYYPRGLHSAQVSDNERELMQFGQQEGQNDADNNGQSSIQLILHIVDG